MFSLAYNLPKAMSIFSHQNCLAKTKQEQRGYFDWRNYIKTSAWKQRGFSDQQNYIEKSTSKRGGFFDQRNYIEKVRGNDLKIRQNLVFNIWT